MLFISHQPLKNKLVKKKDRVATVFFQKYDGH